MDAWFAVGTQLKKQESLYGGQFSWCVLIDGLCRKEVIPLAKQLVKPGEDNKPRGEYIERGPRGGKVSNPRRVTIQTGHRLPPTQEKGRTWERL